MIWVTWIKITPSEWDPVREEIATNRDKSHVFIVHGKILKYYEKDVSWEEYENLRRDIQENTLQTTW
ncbi:17192_t:CDS:1, partial [Rhizophagus irregularis]